MKKNLTDRGMASIIEVIVTAVIFIIAAFGILTTASMLKPHSSSSAKKLEAAYIGKAAIEELRSQVDAASWSDPQGPLATGQAYTETFGDYTVEYTLTDVPGTSVRQLEMAVKWLDENGPLPTDPETEGSGTTDNGDSDDETDGNNSADGPGVPDPETIPDDGPVDPLIPPVIPDRILNPLYDPNNNPPNLTNE